MIDRRRWLTGAVAGIATAGGIAAAWWHARANSATAAGPAANPGANDLAEMWAMHFDRPEGGELDMAKLRGKPLLINFWATWCAPCVRELPAFDRFHREHKAKGWQVLGLAVDGPTPVREFLTRVKIGFPIGLAGLDGTDLIAKLGNLQGGLPFTVIIDSQGHLVQHRMGETSLGDLTAWAATVR